jgi:hypothetical protein
LSCGVLESAIVPSSLTRAYPAHVYTRALVEAMPSSWF